MKLEKELMLKYLKVESIEMTLLGDTPIQELDDELGSGLHNGDLMSAGTIIQLSLIHI